MASSADDPDAFDEGFQLATCDLSAYLRGDATAKAAFVADLHHAMADIGFVILTGHGVAPDLYRRAEQWVEDLFTTPSLGRKLEFRAARHGAVSEGYFPVRETSQIHPDMVEGWVFGRRAFDLGDTPASGTTGSAATDRACSTSVADFWPDPTFEPLFRELINAHVPLFAPIMSAILEGLGCDPAHFAGRMQRPHFGQRLNWYPPITDTDSTSGAGRLLGHEDIDLFTLLPAPTVEGLEALHRNGKWVRLRAPEGSIIVNTGDYLARISNDILPSTTHRVSPPADPADQAKGRVSFPLAAYLPPDDVLEVLPGIANPKYEPIKVVTFHTATTAKFYGDDYAVVE